MPELSQPIKPGGESLVTYMMAQTTQGKMQSYHKRHGEAELLQQGFPCLWKGAIAGKDQLRACGEHG